MEKYGLKAPSGQADGKLDIKAVSAPKQTAPSLTQIKES
jgi:hypothetical protein